MAATGSSMREEGFSHLSDLPTLLWVLKSGWNQWSFQYWLITQAATLCKEGQLHQAHHKDVESFWSNLVMVSWPIEQKGQGVDCRHIICFCIHWLLTLAWIIYQGTRKCWPKSVIKQYFQDFIQCIFVLKYFTTCLNYFTYRCLFVLFLNTAIMKNIFTRAYKI